MAQAESIRTRETRHFDASGNGGAATAALPRSLARYAKGGSIGSLAARQPATQARPFPFRVRAAAAAAARWLLHNTRVALASTTADDQRALRTQPAVLRTLIRNARIALVTTRDTNGALHTQPMEPAERDFDGEIWFGTPSAAPVVDDILASPAIQLTYVEPTSNRCLVLDGVARICTGADAGRVFIRVDVVSADVWE